MNGIILPVLAMATAIGISANEPVTKLVADHTSLDQPSSVAPTDVTFPPPRTTPEAEYTPAHQELHRLSLEQRRGPLTLEQVEAMVRERHEAQTRENEALLEAHMAVSDADRDEAWAKMALWDETMRIAGVKLLHPSGPAGSDASFEFTVTHGATEERSEHRLKIQGKTDGNKAFWLRVPGTPAKIVGWELVVIPEDPDLAPVMAFGGVARAEGPEEWRSSLRAPFSGPPVVLVLQPTQGSVPRVDRTDTMHTLRTRDSRGLVWVHQPGQILAGR